eukprot:scaffold849_cov386-Prasinococcus_capsulatus_cf.AAC.20
MRRIPGHRHLVEWRGRLLSSRIALSLQHRTAGRARTRTCKGPLWPLEPKPGPSFLWPGGRCAAIVNAVASLLGLKWIAPSARARTRTFVRAPAGACVAG